MDRPVIPAFRGAGMGVDPEKPAGTNQANENLREAAEAAGLRQRPRTHDIRRESGRGIAKLGAIASVANSSTAAGIGHTEKALSRGVTGEYVGPINDDLWKARVMDKALDHFETTFGIQTADQPYKKRRLTTEEITKKAIALGKDPNHQLQEKPPEK